MLNKGQELKLVGSQNSLDGVLCLVSHRANIVDNPLQCMYNVIENTGYLQTALIGTCKLCSIWKMTHSLKVQLM